MTGLSREEVEALVGSIEKEGFAYCFMRLHDWKTKYYESCTIVKDKKFHELRKEFIKSTKEFDNYIKRQAKKYDIDYEGQ